MNKTSVKNDKRVKRHTRIRAKVIGTGERPRLHVFRSNRFIYAALIDDASGKTLASISDQKVKGKGKVKRAEEIGKQIAEKAKSLGIKKVVFDRGGFLYTGRLKALAEAVRVNNLEF